MADKDITAFSEFFDVWLPTRVKDNVEPVVSSAEHTIEQMNKQVNANIRSRLVPLISSNHAMDNKVMNMLDNRISVSEGKNQALDNTILDRLETKLVPIETNLSFTPLDCPVNLFVLEATVREQYHYLLMTNDRQSFCVHNNPSFTTPLLGSNIKKAWIMLHNFSTWFRAYLAFYLLESKAFRSEELDNYVDKIEHVELYDGQSDLVAGTIEAFLQ